MTLIELEAASGVGASTISKIERGVTRPQAATVRKLADALGIEVGELYPKAQAPLPDFEDERRESKTPEAAYHLDPYGWVKHKSTEELLQIGLEQAQYTKGWPHEEWLALYEADYEAWKKEGGRRATAPVVVRNILGELELRDGEAAAKAVMTLKHALRQHDEFMNSPEEIPQQSHEEQEGHETA